MTNNTLDPSVVERLWFETLIADLSTRFVNLPATLVDSSIEDVQRLLCERLDLDRSTLWQESEDEPGGMLLTHLYERTNGELATRQMQPGLFTNGTSTVDQPAAATNQTRISASTVLPWTLARIQRGETVVISALTELPKEAATDRETFRRYRTRSTVAVPLSVAGERLGFLTFVAMDEERRWSDDLVRRFQLIGNLMANALARKRADLELRDSKERLRLAIEVAGAGSWMIEPGSDRAWVTNRIRELFQFVPEEKLTYQSFLQRIHPEDRKRVQDAVQHALESGGPLAVDYRLALPDGTARWISSRGGWDPTVTGQTTRLMGVSLDISERKSGEEKLRKSLAEIEALRDRLQVENDYVRAESKVGKSIGAITGQSPAIRKVLYQVQQVAPTDSTVLISGETGVGKELFAEAIHSLSPRKNRMLVKVNCAALPPPLVESELFGREKGAYTGALAQQHGRFDLADQSSIFLDEVGELSLEAQAKLLRVLEEGSFERLGSPRTIKVNVRLIAATNRDLAEEVRKGRFRQDLLYRLNVFPIRVPPLRERPEDIPQLLWTFVEEFSERMGKKITQIPRNTIEKLQRHSWPGNVRELRNVVERSMIVSSGETLRISPLQELLRTNGKPLTLADSQREHILRVLEQTLWHVKGPHGAAEQLGLKPSTLYTRMQKLGIPNRHQRTAFAP